MHLQMLLSKGQHFRPPHRFLAGVIQCLISINLVQTSTDLKVTLFLSYGKTAPDSYRWLCLDFISSQDIGSTPIANVQETKKQSEETMDE